MAAPDDPLQHLARRGLWALPVWAVLLFYATLEHQPSDETDFPGYARFITTGAFLVSHLLGSILGAAMGVLGFVALAIVLAGLGRHRIAAWALVTAVIGSLLITSVFGVAAFAQPAIGRAYRAGLKSDIPPLNDDVYGPELTTTALVGSVLFVTGIILFGVGVIRAAALPTPAGIGLIIGGPLFGLIGVILANAVQSVGAALLVISAAWIAWAGQRARRDEAAVRALER
jgi:hypothetical protein